MLVNSDSTSSDLSSSFYKGGKSLIFFENDGVSPMVNSFLHKVLRYWDITWAAP